MRIISQDRELDIPYQEVSLTVIGDTIYYGDPVYQIDKSYFLGAYDTKERCLKIMKEIQRQYNCGARIYKLPKE